MQGRNTRVHTATLPKLGSTDALAFDTATTVRKPMASGVVLSFRYCRLGLKTDGQQHRAIHCGKVLDVNRESKDRSVLSASGEALSPIRVQGEKSIWISGSLSGSQQHGRSTRYSPLIRTRRLRVIDGHQRVGNSDRWVDALPQSPLDPQCDVRRRASNAVEHQRPIAPVLWHGFQLRGVQLFTNTRSFAPLASPPEALPEA